MRSASLGGVLLFSTGVSGRSWKARFWLRALWGELKMVPKWLQSRRGAVNPTGVCVRLR